LVLFVGSHTGGQVTNDWQIPRTGTRIIQLDLNPSELGRSFPVSVAMQGDARESLRMMIAEAGAVAQRNGRTKWIERVQRLVSEWRESVAAFAKSDATPMRPERLCAELSEALPGNAVLVSDTGHSGIWTGTMIDLKSPDQSYIRCAGSLGWAIPAAIGAKCAVPDRPVICFCGDAGAWYHFTELDMARRWGINTITVINNNQSMNQERVGVERAYGGRSKDSDSLWTLNETDFAALADALGCCGIRVKKPGEISGALQRAMSAGKPAVIDVRTDIDGIAPQSWN